MDNFLIYLAESGISLFLFFSVYWFFLRKDTFFSFNRSFLLLSVPISLLIPFLDLSFLGINFTIFQSHQISTTGFEATTSDPESTFGLKEFFMLIYVQGIVFLTIRFLYQIFKLVFLIKKFCIKKQDGFKIIVTDNKYSPFSFFNYIFINQKNFSADNYERILAHEKIHIKQFHSFDLLLSEFLIIFQWFNPFVWPYKSALKETHEYLADEGVIAQGFSTAKYQMLIFEQLVGVKLFEFANNFNDSQIKRRLKMMTKNKSKNWRKLKVLTAVPVVLLLVVAFSTPPEIEAVTSEDLIISQPGLTEDQQVSDQDKKKKEKMKQEKLIADKKAKYLKEIWTKVDKKLADKSLSKKEREELLKKKISIETEIKMVNSPSRKKADFNGSNNLLAERKAIEKKLASKDLSKKDKIILSDKLKKIEVTLKKQQMADEKKMYINKNNSLVAERKAIEKKLASGKLSKEQKSELKNKMKKIDQVIKEQEKMEKIKSGDAFPPPPPPPKKN